MEPRRRELLDDPATPVEEIAATLRDQAWINRRLGGFRAVWPRVKQLLDESTGESLWVADLACGGGDFSRRLVDEARRRGRDVRVLAVDLNPQVLSCAREWSRDYPEISFVRADLTRLPLASRSFNLVVLAAVLHHLTPEGAVRALQEADRIGRGLAVASDLVRSAPAAWGFPVWGRLLGLRRISRYDGTVSLRQAFTPAELAGFAETAGLGDARVYRSAGLRMTLVWRPRATSA